MSLRTSLILMVLFLGLGYFAFFDPLRTDEKAEEQKDRDSHVVWLKDKKLESISVSGEKPAIQLVCARADKACPFDSKGEWQLTQPEKDIADASAVGTLASSMLNLTQNGKLDFDSGYDEKEFGLDHPQAVVTLQVQGDKAPLVLKFGKASAVGPNIYLSSSADPKHLFLVANYLPGMLNKDPFHWRNKRLFPSAEATAVGRITWTSKKIGEVRATRAKEEWRLERPLSGAASKIMMEGLGSTLSYAVAKSIYAPLRHSPDAQKLISGKPDLEVSFTVSDGSAHTLKLFPKPGVGKDAREMLALVDSLEPVFSVDASTFDRFSKNLMEYRQRTMIDEALRDKVDEIHFTFPRDKQEISLKLMKDQWALSGGDKLAGVLSSSRVASFLDSLRDSDFKAFFPLKGPSAEAKAYRSEKPDLQVELKGHGMTLFEAKFVVFQRKQGLTESEGDVRSLGEAFLKFLPVRLSDLTEAANTTVVVKPEKGGPDGHSSQSE